MASVASWSGTVAALVIPAAWATFVNVLPPAQDAAITFTRVAVPGPTTDRASTGGVSWIDADHDGDPDLVVVNGFDVSRPLPMPQPDHLYLNDGRGGFTSAAGWPPSDRQVFSSGSTWGDIDNDGDPDAFIASQRRTPGLLLRNLGGARFERIEATAPATDSLVAYSAAFVDIDRDGFLDLSIFTGGLSSLSTNAAYRGLGDGRFERVMQPPFSADTAASGGGVWVDLDDDGDDDLIVPVNGMRGRLRHLVYRNDGNWRLTPVAVPAMAEFPVAASALVAGDFDNDGDQDLLLAAERGIAMRLFRNDGAWQFTAVMDSPLSQLPGGNQPAPVTGDFDNDGDLDVVVARWGAAPSLFVNHGNGTFRVASAPGSGGDLTQRISFKGSIASADYDLDGDLDLYLGSWPDFPGPDEENVLFRNDSPARNWLRIELEGTRSNRSAIGARVSVRATIGGRAVTQRRDVRAHSTFRSMDDLVQHVGLGDAARADSVVVRWPSGAVEACAGLPARATVRIVEGRGWAPRGGTVTPCR